MFRRHASLSLLLATWLVASCQCTETPPGECAGGECDAGIERPVDAGAPGDGGEVSCAPCEAQHRTCDAGGTCGNCAAGYVEVEGACELEVTCADEALLAACAGDNRECADIPNGHCGACVQGFVPDDPELPDEGACRLPLNCADLSCPAEQFCVSPPAADAFCSDECATPDGTPGVEFPNGTCALCPPCDRDGYEDGPYLEALSGADRCICETLPGNYWEEGSASTKRCDADGDGFVTLSARPALNAPSGSAVRVNARCDLRTIDRVVVVNEAGEELVEALSTAAPLYETERNDDADAMARVTVEATPPQLPPYGERFLTVEELNSFTKACAGKNADFNDNGLADVGEYQERSSSDISSSRAALRPFLPFGYFVELYQGAFVAPATGETHGQFRITERPRDPLQPDAIPLVYPAATAIEPAEGGGTREIDADYWQVCDRRVDSAYALEVSGGVPVGFDFARLDDVTTWSGANHHSQFKCVEIVEAAMAGDPPQAVPAADLTGAAPKLIANDCAAGATAPPAGSVDAINPSSPALSCSLDGAPAVGSVTFAVVPYRPYADPWTPGSPGLYQGGCVNECAEYRDQCPGHDDARPELTQCVGDTANYGRLFCGCGPNSAFPGCSVGCGDLDVRTSKPSAPNSPYVDGEFRIAPRLGWWMCGELVMSGEIALTDDTGSWSLRGGISPRMTPPPEPLGSESGGWTLR